MRTLKVVLASLLMLAAASSGAQTFTNLVTLTRFGNAFPFGGVVQGLDGNFYGTTSEGGGGQAICAGGCGTVFKVTPDGTLTTLHKFVGKDGGFPVAGLSLATNGNFYGSTYGYGPYSGFGGLSFFFEMTPSGTLTNLSAGGSPAPLIQDTVDGNFYGIFGSVPAPFFGSLSNPPSGVVFKMTPSGSVTKLHTFCQLKNCADGGAPLGPLVQSANGFLYGTTYNGGVFNQTGECSQNYGCGTVFKIGTGGALAIVHKFNNIDGNGPDSGLVLGPDGNLYGTEIPGPVSSFGTIFKITPSGTVTTLYQFCQLPNCADGFAPIGGLVLATDGNFYGTTAFGGDTNCHSRGNGCGTVFQITLQGVLTTIHSFNGTDGQSPYAPLIQATDGDLYGTTTGYTAQFFGSVFKISMGLPPFVKTSPTAAFPGATINLLGNNLTGATSVTFNGKAAAFTVISATQITAKVPSGATTGTIEVTTPSATLSSNMPFRVF